MAKNSNSSITKKIAQTCINALPKEKHLSILQEMYGFIGVLNFPQTIQSLITLNQMDVFGISKEMQIILKHIAQLKSLGSMSLIRKYFQYEYESIHQRTVVVVQIGNDEIGTLTNILNDITKKMNGKCDFVYQSYNLPGVIIKYKDQILEYTPYAITKILKSA